MPVKLVVDADGAVDLFVDFDVVSVHGEDLDRVDSRVLHAAFLCVGEHVDAEDRSRCTGVNEIQRLIRPEEVVNVRLRVDG